MIIDTTAIVIDGTIYVRIPSNVVDNFELRGRAAPFDCKIEDISKTEARIIF